MAEFPALMLWTDAYLADTTHLNTAQHGAYLLLLMTAWRRSDCDLPDDDEFLARVVRQRVNNWRRWFRPWLEPMFVVDDGRWVQKRLKLEREHAAAVSKRRSDNARSRYQTAICRDDQEPPKPLQSNGSGSANAEQMPCYPKPTTNTKKETPPTNPPQPKKAPRAEPAVTPHGATDSFRKWYAGYPRKVGRACAEKAYRRAMSRASPEELADGLMRAISGWQQCATQTEFIPHPATWLNRDGWADEHYRPNGNGKSYIELVRESLMETDDDGNRVETIFDDPEQAQVLPENGAASDAGRYGSTGSHLRTINGGLLHSGGDSRLRRVEHQQTRRFEGILARSAIVDGGLP